MYPILGWVWVITFAPLTVMHLHTGCGPYHLNNVYKKKQNTNRVGKYPNRTFKHSNGMVTFTLFICKT